LFLFAQVHVTRNRAVLAVAGAYGFSALMATVHLLSFPGLFAPTGLVGGNQQTTAYLYVFWHAGFACGLLLYALLRRSNGRADTPAHIGRGVGLVAMAVALLAGLATMGSAWLPPVLAGDTYSSVFSTVRYGQWVLTVAAMVAVWRIGQRTILDVWLLVVLANYFIEIGLVAVFNAGRYDIGFYAGRIFALLASCFVLAVMLFEQARLYGRLVAAQETALSEVRLREGREALRSALVAGGVGAWSVDLRSGRVWWSVELEEAAGFAPGSFAGTRQACFRQIHPQDVPPLRRAYRLALTRGTEFDFECRLLDGDGEWRWTSGRGRPEPGADGTPERLVGSVMDITDRKRAEASARELESSLRGVAEHLPVMAWMVHPDGAVAWFNQRWHEYTGMGRRRGSFRGWKSFAHPGSLGEVAAAFERCLATGESYEGVIHWRGLDGGYRPFLTRFVPIRGGDGDVVRWVGTSTDISEQHSAELALRTADRRKNAFLATLVHELRTPLAPIRHAVELLGRMGSLPADAARMLSIIDRQSLQLSRLVEDLLDAARITQGKLELRPEHTSLAVALTDAVDAVRPSCAASGHEIFLLLGNEDVHLTADPARLRQVFVNLLNNAAKFTPHGGRISVRVVREGPDVHVIVNDTGIGISAAYLPRIFDLFSRYVPEGDPRGGGLGIGLALAKSIVAGHGGAISVMSPGPEGGTEFTVTLPLQATTASADIYLPEARGRG
jgi:PAS domain S-box-containing protein